MNFDESCFICNDRNLKILGDGKKTHYNNNIADSSMSITSVRCGSAAGTNVAVVFIANGKNVNHTFSQYRLRHTYVSHKGSIVLCNKTAYMDDDRLIKTVQIMAP